MNWGGRWFDIDGRILSISQKIDNYAHAMYTEESNSKFQYQGVMHLLSSTITQGRYIHMYDEMLVKFLTPTF